MRDYEDLPKYIKAGIAVHFVEHYDEVFDIAFPGGVSMIGED